MTLPRPGALGLRYPVLSGQQSNRIYGGKNGDQVARSKNPKRYSPEFKDEAAKMVVDLCKPIAQVAQELGINRITLGFWVKAYRRHHPGDELPIDMPDRARNSPDEPADITSAPANITDQPANITGPSDVSGDNADRAELTRQISPALAGLDHDEREAIELNLRQDLEIADLATVPGMPRNKVDALASRTRGKLERALGALLVARMGRQSWLALDTLLADWDGRLTTLTAPTRDLAARTHTPHVRFAGQQQGRRSAGRHRDGLVEVRSGPPLRAENFSLLSSNSTITYAELTSREATE